MNLINSSLETCVLWFTVSSLGMSSTLGWLCDITYRGLNSFFSRTAIHHFSSASDMRHLFVFQSMSCPMLSKHSSSNLQHLHLLMPTKEELQWEELNKTPPLSEHWSQSGASALPKRVYRGVSASRRPHIKHWYRSWRKRSWRILLRTSKDLWKVQGRDSLSA